MAKPVARVYTAGVDLLTRTRRLVLPVLALWLLPVAGFFGQPAEKPQSLTVAAGDTYSPYFFRGEKGQLQGVVVDLWRLWEKQAGIRVEFIATNWEAAMRLVAEGKADVLETVFYSQKRDEYYDFTKPYDQVDTCIFFQAEIPGVDSVDSLSAFTVGLVAGDYAGPWLRQHAVTNVIEYPSYVDLVEAAAREEIRVFVCDSATARFFLYRMGLVGRFRVSAPLYTEGLRRAVREGRMDLVALIERGFEAVGREAHDGVMKRWTGETLIPFRLPQSLLVIAAAVLLLILLLFIWNRQLQRVVARRTAESADSAAQLRALFEGHGAILLVVDPASLVIIDANPAAAEYYGYEREALIALPLRGIVSLPEGVLRRRIAEIPVGGYEKARYRHRLACGEEREVEVRTSLVRMPRGMALFSIVEDIADRLAAEDLLRRAKESAEEADAAKSRFLANMSHEIRTPLTGLLGMGRLLEQTRLDADQQQYLRMMLQTGTLLSGIVNDILDLSSLEAGRYEATLEAFSPRQILETARGIVLEEVGRKGLDLKLRVGEGVPDLVSGPAHALTRIVVNLVGNAVKFTDQGSVELMVEVADPGIHGVPAAGTLRLVFLVGDTGIGIPEDRHQDVFSRFVRLAGVDGQERSGTGLGLAIVRGLADRIGARLILDSAPGRGSLFTLVLDLATVDGMPARVAPADQVGAEGAGRARRVLVVEDNAISGLYLKRFLERHGYAVTSMICGAAALEAVSRDAYSLVLMDVQMAGMDGMETTRRMRAAGLRMPIIALTAYAGSSDREACRAAGMDDYIAKPVDEAALLETIRRYCG